MRDLPQYDRRAVNVTLSLPDLHDLLGLRGDARIMNVQFLPNLQLVTFTVEGPLFSNVAAWDEPFVVQLATVQEHRA